MNYITIVATHQFFGTDIFKVGQVLTGVKEPENSFDSEAIKVVTESDVPCGYIANSVHTVAKGCHSAGRIYDSFENRVKMKVLFIVKNVVIAEILLYEKVKDYFPGAVPQAFSSLEKAGCACCFSRGSPLAVPAGLSVSGSQRRSGMVLNAAASKRAGSDSGGSPDPAVLDRSGESRSCDRILLFIQAD